MYTPQKVKFASSTYINLINIYTLHAHINNITSIDTYPKADESQVVALF